ncbi:MAG: N-acetylmuramyl-L-alanine amidase, negative regulator of AmpC, AmpD, partial [Chloroflexi bacterium]|nr:N-acetylmuramyl-L-alanine amidase, negative regulator of AmpC, AmpD [Chloroflexota bacterium]
LPVPSSLSAGQHTLIAYGVTSKRLANNTVQIVKAVVGPATIKLDRTTANPGSLVQISGQNFGSKETVNVSFGSTVVLTATTAVSGTFGPVGFTIPTNAAPGAIAVTVTGQTSKSTATSSITVVAFTPSLSVAPTSATPGTSETVSGQGYAAGEIITLALNGQALTTNPSVIKTTSTGTFTATFTVPATALSGANTLAATGTTSRASATASITVSLPLQSTWYFAGGSTNPGYSTQIALTNPNDQPAVVTFSFMFTTGSTMPYTTTVPANSRATVDVGSVVGQNRDVFTMLTADRKIGASETLFRNGQDFSSTIGASAPLRTWYLAEGYTGLTFHEYIRIFNPGTTVAHADIRLLPFNGRAATSVTKTVNPKSGLIVDVNSIAPNLSLSAIVDSDQPVVVDRLMTFGINSYGATEQVGSNTPSSTWLFAEGSTLNNFETFMTVLNPSTSQPAAVTATFFDHAGNVLGNDTIIIDPLRRGNIKLNDFIHSSGIATILTSNIPVLAERPLYFGAPNSKTAAAGGSDVFGRNGGGVTWLFPEGNTGSNFKEFLLLQNPSSQAAPVTVRFYQTNGKTVDYSVVLPAKSRATVDVLKDVPSLAAGTHSALVSSTSGVPIIAEQSIYSDNFTKGDGEAGIAQ